MTRPTFGQREAKSLSKADLHALKQHAAYRKGEVPAEKPRRMPVIDRILAWFSYFTLVFTTIVTFTPDSAAAAVLHVSRIVSAIPV